MPTNLPDEQKAMQDNHAKMPKISFFNDEYREVIKGGSSDNVLVNKGFITGNLYETEKARKDQKKLLSVFLLGMMRIANTHNFTDRNGACTIFQNKPFGNKKGV